MCLRANGVQSGRGRGVKRGGGRTSGGSRRRPAKASAGADLIGRRILVLQGSQDSEPEWHIGTVEDWQGVSNPKSIRNEAREPWGVLRASA